jgi:hypothetical protein
MRISVIRSLRSIGQAQPKFAFEKAKVFWEDPNPVVISEVLELIKSLPSPYLAQSLPLVRKVLSRAKSQRPEFSIDAPRALSLLEVALAEYPNEVFEATAEYLRQYFGEDDQALQNGEYPLDHAFKLLSRYVLVEPNKNIHVISKLLEERFRTYWSRYYPPDTPYDGMRGLSLVWGGVDYETPSLDEDSMVENCLIAPLLEFAGKNSEEAIELAMSFADDTNAFARRTALHVALQLSLKGDRRGDGLIEKAVDAYLGSHDYISVFQTAESLLVPLAAQKGPVALNLLRKLSKAGVGYLGSYEIAALLTLAEANDDARNLLQRILAEGMDHLVRAVIRGAERLAQSQPAVLENMLHVVVDRYAGSPPPEISSISVDAAAILARSSWNLMKPFFELVVSSPEWIQASNVGQRLAEIAKTNPDARTDVSHMLESLAHSPSRGVRQGALLAVSELREISGAFGLSLLEALSEDPDPSPTEDERLLGSSVRDAVVLQTVRGTVATLIPDFAHVDKDRCWNLLVKLSVDMSAYVRTMAVRSLGQLVREPKYLKESLTLLLCGGPKGVGLLRDESAWVRHGSLYLVLRHLQSSTGSADTLYSSIENARHDTDAQVRFVAVRIVVNAVAITRKSAYEKLLQEILDSGATEERSTLAHYVRRYMETNERGSYDVFKPILTKLASDADPRVRERVALSLDKWAEVHPDDVAQWCCLLVEMEARCSPDHRSAMTGHSVSQALNSLLPGHPEEAVKILECIEKLPDEFGLNQILTAAKALPVEFRSRARPVVENLLKRGLPAAQQLLESWEKPG